MSKTPPPRNYGWHLDAIRTQVRMPKNVLERPGGHGRAEHDRWRIMSRLIFETTAMAEDLLKSTTACLKADLPALAPLMRERWDQFLTDAIKEELRIRGEE